MKFRIHQIKDIENTTYAFRGFNPARFNFKDYECVYEGEIEAGDKIYTEICEVLFYLLNMHRPEDYRARSLSVSDVIELQPNGVPTYYYCDICGFSRLNRQGMKSW